MEINIIYDKSYGMGSDGTSCSECHFEKNPTLGEFVEWVLRRGNEWGKIAVNRGFDDIVEYSHGKIINDKSLYEKYKDETVELKTISGGWSEVNYLLRSDRIKMNETRIIKIGNKHEGGIDMKTIEERARDFAIEKCCAECKRNSECKNNKSAKCALVLRYDVMYQRIAKEQQEITKQEIVIKAKEAFCNSKFRRCNVPRDTCLRLGTCCEYDDFSYELRKLFEE